MADDLHSPFISMMRLNLPRVGNREGLTLNFVAVGASCTGGLTEPAHRWFPGVREFVGKSLRSL